MQCDQDDATLVQYLDGELSPEQAITLQQHIGECPRCAAEVSELVSLKRSLRVASMRLDLEPDPVAVLRQPDSRHPGSAVARDHPD